MNIKEGYYTCDNSELYVEFTPINEIQAKYRLFYKYGEYKDYLVDEGIFTVVESRLSHWKEYEEGK